MAHVAEYKKKIVNEFVKLMEDNPIIGAINMENIPSPQLQVMRATLRDSVVIKMSKRRLIKIAIEKAKKDKPGLEKIEEFLGGMPAMLFTKENPFKLYSKLKKSKSSAPAKAGQTAPRDIIIPAGPTPFAPGPVISELGACGIKAGVEGGKVAVKKDCVVVKEGEPIKAEVASILTRLGIEPMEIGLDLVAVYEDGTIYTKDVLDIDEGKFMQDLQSASAGAFNLAIEIAYPSKDTTEFLISKAYNDAKALALEQEIMCNATAEMLLSKAEAQAKSLAEEAKIDLTAKPKEKKEETKEKEKAESKPEPQEHTADAKPQKAPEQKVEEKKKPKVKGKKEEPKPEIKEELKEENKGEAKDVPKDSEQKEGGN